MMTTATRNALLSLSLASGVLARAGSADAQVLSRFSLRAEVGAGIMTPTVQRSALGYDGVHIQATGRLGFDVIDWLSLQLSVNNGFFPDCAYPNKATFIVASFRSRPTGVGRP